ncbi:alpha/beta hydrolase [Minwuia sp.]|uniref:alpha/beta hydrolase n=1 Tax=Minwuia sp. TaxID=2493630 RepID=UPI003A909DFC
MILFIVIATVAALVVLFLLGPRDRVAPGVPFSADSLGDNLDAVLARSEAKYPDIRPGLQKEIIWRDPGTKARTDWAIVYIHGFSAAKPETRPLPDLVADALGANLFFTRLTGHGRTGEALAQANGGDWLNDAAEALAIGRRIGKRVLVMATSTGATAVAPLALDNEAGADAMVFVSPNFGLRAKGAEYMTIPWGRQIATWVLGRERNAATDNEAYNTGWTVRYPTVSLAPMMALVQHVRRLPFEEARTPVMMLHAPDDQVVQPAASRTVFARWGAPKLWLDVPGTRGPTHHVIAGDIINPEMTEPLAARIIDWVRSLDR